MEPHIELKASKRARYPGARFVGPIDPNEPVELTVVLKPSDDLAADIEELGAQPPGERRGRRAAVPVRHRIADAGLTALRRFAREFDLRVANVDKERHTAHLRGPLGNMLRAFQTKLATYERGGVRFRMRTGFLRIPADLAPYVVAVLGLDDRPQARSHARRASSGTLGFPPQQVAKLYDFPPGDGRGQTIALIELGGAFDRDDLAWYFRGIGMPVIPVIEAVYVDGIAPLKYRDEPNDDDGEVMLDVEVAGAVAPGARIVVYFTPNTDRGFYDALAAAVYDDRRRPSVISISWGAAEKFYTPQMCRAFDELAMHAALRGITIVVASGDDGASDLNPSKPGFDQRHHVDFPASSPHVLACGGTRLTLANGALRSERAWHGATGASGGGISTLFAVPRWQRGCTPSIEPLLRRGVPDVAGNGDPDSGYACFANRQLTSSAGTSAVAPLWAGLIARINENLGTRCGFVTPLLYASASRSGALRDVRLGDNGCHTVHGYRAKRGWDACTGLGTPNGRALMRLLRGRPRRRARAT
ncbi:MAG TPA: S53 family peptidase [Candidatus Limnocylindrales bacterium]|nr:S53 family peptidase [Candidatus Limnocylindrales bacterium]